MSLSLHTYLTTFSESLKTFSDDDDFFNFEYLSASLTTFIFENMVGLLIPVIRDKNLSAIYCVSVKFNLPNIKQKLESIIKNSVYNLPHKLLNYLRLRIFGNWKRKTKSQNWIEKQTSVKSLLQKLIFGNRNQNLRKSRYQTFLVLLNFTWFFHFCQNVLSLIAWQTKSFLITCHSIIKPQYSHVFNKLQSFVKLFVEI